MKYVAVLGYGTVGGGVVDIIEKNKKEVSGKAGDEVGVKYILDLRDFPGDPYENKVVHDFEIIANDPEIDIVVEAMGGTVAAYKFTKQALLSGKSVCTSNKAVVAAFGPELLDIAKANNCSYLFEASVGGGIPIIRPLNTCLTAEHIESITGILNGTTNYMLTKMDKEGCDYDEVLKEAQAKGYAEANPEADVCGHDTCRKIAILSSLAWGKTVNYENIPTEGITSIKTIDFEYAKAIGCSVKLLGLSRDVNGKCLAMVAPFMVAKECSLYNVNDVFNGILVHGNMVDDVMFFGRGAGKEATASAVVSDIIEIAKNLGSTIECSWKNISAQMADESEMRFKYFVRVDNKGKDELLKAVCSEKVVVLEENNEEVGVLTGEMNEMDFKHVVEMNGDSIRGFIRLY